MWRMDGKGTSGKALILAIVLLLALAALGLAIFWPDGSAEPARRTARPQTPAPAETVARPGDAAQATESEPAGEVSGDADVSSVVPAEPTDATPKPTTVPVTAAERTTRPVTQPVAATEPASQPVAVTQPATQPTAATQPAAGAVPAAPPQTDESEAVAADEPEEEPAIEADAEAPADADDESVAALPPADDRSIRFQFDGVPCDEVIRRFAQMSGRPIIGDLGVDGTLTFQDPEPYSYGEALDTLNLILSMRGYHLMEAGRYIRLVPLADLPQMPLPILRGLDDTQEVRAEEVVTVVLPLKYVDAGEAQSAVVRMVSSYGSVTALGRSKGLIITDRLSNIRRIQSLLNELESEPLGEEQLRVVKLSNASAEQVASILMRLFGRGGIAPQPQQRPQPRQRTRRPQPQQPPQQQPQPGGGSGTFIATADERTNMVLLVGPPDKLAMAEQLVEQLDREEGVTDSQVRIFELSNARAEDVASTITQVMTGQSATVRRGRRPPTPAATGEVRAVADAATNRVVVSASTAQMEEIEDLIRELDEATSIADGARIFRLETADAQQLSRVIASASAKRDARGRTQTTLNVTADSQTNSLIVAGPAADIQTAAGLIAELDRPQDGTLRELHVVPLEAGDARQIARSLMNIFADRGGRRGQQGPTALRVEAESDTNSLIISAAPGDWPLIGEILTELQAAGLERASPATRLVVLKHAQADDLANTLSRIYSRRRGRGGDVTIAPSRQSNSLLISASETDHEAIAELIRSMDQPSLAEIAPVQIIRLSSADATNLAEKLQAMLPRGGRDREIFIQADRQTNSVLLRAPQAERAMLEDMIAQLDQATQAEARELRIVKLTRASATAMAEVVGQLYDSGQQQGRRGRGQEAQGDEVLLSAGPGDQSLLVEAPKSKVEEIVQLVRSLDEEEDPERLQIRTYQLTNANAREVAASLGKLFAEQRQTRRRGQREAAPIQPRFEADSGSNQLLVAAMAEQFEEIEAVIEKLETTTVPASQTRMFRLEHASAADVVNLLKSLMEQQRDSRSWMWGGRQEDQAELRIAAMVSANTVVVKGSPGQLALAEEIVKTFDTPSGSGQLTMEIVHLENAQAETLAQAVSATLNAAQQGRRRSRNWWEPQDTSAESLPVTVTAEPNSNALLVRGPAADVPGVVEMIHNLDRESSSALVEMRVYPLAHSEAKPLADALGRMFNEIIRQQSRGRRDGQNPVFSVTADERTNSLVVSSTAANFVLVERLLENLDRAP